MNRFLTVLKTLGGKAVLFFTALKTSTLVGWISICMTLLSVLSVAGTGSFLAKCAMIFVCLFSWASYKVVKNRND